MEPSPVDTALFGVWGSADVDGEVFAVGMGGTILHDGGQGWTVQDSGTSADLMAVWGTSSTNVYAVGSNVILKYDGTGWTPIDGKAGPVGFVYTDIWGRGPEDIFVVGVRYAPAEIVDIRGIIRHYDGREWSLEQIGMPQPVADIWGFDSGSVYAVGGGGRILKRTAGTR